MKIEINQARIHKTKAKSQLGFTLTEIMLVVVIIGILAALVIPKIAGSGERARVTAATADINGGIRARPIRSGQRILSEKPAGFDRAAGQREELARAVF